MFSHIQYLPSLDTFQDCTSVHVCGHMPVRTDILYQSYTLYNTYAHHRMFQSSTYTYSTYTLLNVHLLTVHSTIRTLYQTNTAGCYPTLQRTLPTYTYLTYTLLNVHLLQVVIPLFNEVDGDTTCLPAGFVYTPSSSRRSEEALLVLETSGVPIDPRSAILGKDAYNPDGCLMSTEPNGILEIDMTKQCAGEESAPATLPANSIDSAPDEPAAGNDESAEPPTATSVFDSLRHHHPVSEGHIMHTADVHYCTHTDVHHMYAHYQCAHTIPCAHTHVRTLPMCTHYSH